ncbi:glycine zipper 2TM domain-containing protein [Caballeronia sordidicola]|uniref:glycine zipper 2TM domain-containing protein n=1 Tax=Caballeronia sordidicola TaxID=196367 RepID=UPI000A3A069C|nr:glycine zipper 2TM domain-containing protein [Caballeronia sordidicola]
MNENLNTPQPQRSRIHPLVAAAAVAVILASGVGIAALTGILPTSKAVPAPVTAPLVEGQVSGSSASKQAPLKQVADSAPPTPHHHYEATNERDRAPTEATRAPLADPYSGEVVAVNVVRTAEPTTGLGALGGAVLGGLAGTQVGNGRGRTAATVVGALGGGLAGNTVEHAVHKATSYDVQVRMGDGSFRNFSYQVEPGFQVGQRVHVSGDRLSAS